MLLDIYATFSGLMARDIGRRVREAGLLGWVREME